MATSLSIRQVKTKADLESFVRFPWLLYGDDPNWIPPLVSMQRHKLDQAHNPSWKYMEGDYFLAWRGDLPVGTIAAFINHRHNEFQNEHVGFFGMFDVYDDPEAAHALLETAAEYVRSRGYDAIRGPASFSTNDQCGVLIEGHGKEPALLMPYNYPYYQTLLESAPGFEKVMDLRSYHFTLERFHESKSLEQALRVTRKNNQRRKITVRHLNRRQFKADMEMLREIYNAAWDNNWGFVPLTSEELDELIKELGQFLDPRLGLFAFVEGQPVAFLLAMPDLNQVLHHAAPHPDTPEVLTLIKALWHWKIRPKITRIRIALLGVNGGYRGIGVEAALFAALFDTFDEMVRTTRLRTADAGWVLETNDPMDRLTVALGGEPYRRYRFYERALM